MRDYSDSNVSLSFPEDFKLKATAASAQYYLRKSKTSSVSISVLLAELLGDAFRTMVSAPVPSSDRQKQVHARYKLGKRSGEAIEWEIFGKPGGLSSRVLIFYFEIKQLGVMAEMYFTTDAERMELEEIVASLRVF